MEENQEFSNSIKEKINRYSISELRTKINEEEVNYEYNIAYAFKSLEEAKKYPTNKKKQNTLLTEAAKNFKIAGQILDNSELYQLAEGLYNELGNEEETNYCKTMVKLLSSNVDALENSIQNKETICKNNDKNKNIEKEISLGEQWENGHKDPKLEIPIVDFERAAYHYKQAANLLVQNNQIEEAKQFYKKSLTLYYKEGTKEEIREIITDIACVLLENGYNATAYDFFETEAKQGDKFSIFFLNKIKEEIATQEQKQKYAILFSCNEVWDFNKRYENIMQNKKIQIQ